jgi:hypothetical protein
MRGGLSPGCGSDFSYIIDNQLDASPPGVRGFDPGIGTAALMPEGIVAPGDNPKRCFFSGFCVYFNIFLYLYQTANFFESFYGWPVSLNPLKIVSIVECLVLNGFIGIDFV